MNWLENDAVVVEVLQLDEREASRVTLAVDTVLDLQSLPARLGSSKRMVSVPDENHRGLAAGCSCRGCLFVGECLHRCLNVRRSRGSDAQPLHLARTFEQIDLVLRLSEARTGEERLDDCFVRIVDNHDNVRQLQGCVLTDCNARRQASHNRFFCRPDQRRLRAVVVVRLEVDRQDQALSRRNACSIPVNCYEGRLALGEDPVRDVLLHDLADILDALRVLTWVSTRDGREIHFWEYDVQGRRRVACVRGHLLPILWFRFELVACHGCPLLQGEVATGHQNLGDAERQAIENWLTGNRLLRKSRRLVRGGLNKQGLQFLPLRRRQRGNHFMQLRFAGSRDGGNQTG
mmetsp:Transcript_78844/g.219200  ORF Transcript_78844/g.219200 Transcript_78844/m.219200 type:complete len:346 (+) Transcript_78844:791-1828(+)